MRETQHKGDTAVAQAIATFTKMGYDVSIPFTESAAYDLIIDFYGILRKVQVRFSTRGKEVGLRRIHSNSKGYVVKRPQEGAYDWLYILNGNGEEYLVIDKITNRNAITPQKRHLLGNVFTALLGKQIEQTG